MAVILNGATGGIQLTSASGGTMSVNPPATATSYVSTLPAATGTLLNSASSLAAASLTGTVPTARLGSGTASSSTFLAGDQTYKTISSGGMTLLSTLNTTSGTTATTGTLDLTGYLQLVIWIYSVYPGTGSSVLRMGENGGTQLKIRDLVTSASEPAYMQLNHNLSSGVFITLENAYGMGVNDTSEPRKTGATGIGINTAIDTATTALKFDLEGGQTFTGGSIKVYGLK